MITIIPGQVTALQNLLNLFEMDEAFARAIARTTPKRVTLKMLQDKFPGRVTQAQPSFRGMTTQDGWMVTKDGKQFHCQTLRELWVGLTDPDESHAIFVEELEAAVSRKHS